MTVFQTIWAVIAAVITIAGLVIAFARVAPEDAKKNLTGWISFFGLPRLAQWLRQSGPESFIRIGTGMVGLGAALLGNFAANFLPHTEPQTELSRKLAASEVEVKSLNQQIATLQARTPAQKTGFLALDDADRWRISSTLHSATANVGSGKPCEGRLFGKPNDSSAQSLANELPNILQVGSWRLEGGRNSKSVFPDGITINVGHDTGPDFTCAYRLSEVLQNMRIKPVTLRVNIATPDLIECKDCVEIVFGATKKSD